MPELRPFLVKDGAIQARLLLLPSISLLGTAFGTAALVAHHPVLNALQRLNVGQLRTEFMPKVAASVRNICVQALDFESALLPITRHLDLAALTPLVLYKTM